MADSSPRFPEPAGFRTETDLLAALNDLRVRGARRRGKARLSLQDLTAVTGVPRSSLANYLTGRTLMPLDVLDRLLLALGVDPVRAGAWATRWEQLTSARWPERPATPTDGPTTYADAATPTDGTAPATSTGPADPVRTEGTALPVPAQLPAATGAFIGRRHALAALDALLAAVEAGQPDTVTAVITGTAGVGKTALVNHWAQRHRDKFPDGQLHVNLRGFDPAGTPVSAAEAVQDFLDALGVSHHRIPTSLAAQLNLFRSLLAGRRVLLVLDNARDATHVRPLLPGSPTCLTLITSRNQMPALVAAEGAHPVPLGLLDPEESQALLAHRLGPHRTLGEPGAAAGIVARCAGLPLALAVVAARAATHPHFPLAAIATELRDAPRRLDPLTGGDATIDVRAVFSWSYQQISPAAARLFRLAGLCPGPDLGVAAVASLAGIPRPTARPLLAELVNAHLLTEHQPGRFVTHDLLRAYARELAEADPATERRSAVHRLLDHYLHTAHAAELLLNPPRGPIPLDPPRPGVTPERFADRAAALTWFAAERSVLLAAVAQAAEAGLHTHAWQLPAALVTFLDLRGHWHDWIDTQQTALASAHRLGDRAAEAHVHRLLGSAAIRLGRDAQAHGHHSRALALFQALDDPVNEAFTCRSLAWIADRAGDHRAALGLDLRALDLFRRVGHRDGEAKTLNSIGWCLTQLGDHAGAIDHCERALILLDELDDPGGIAVTLDSLGHIRRRLGEHDLACDLYRRARELFARLGDRHGEAEAAMNLGDTRHERGDHAGAGRAWRHALAILDDLGDPKSAQIRSRLAQPVGETR